MYKCDFKCTSVTLRPVHTKNQTGFEPGLKLNWANLDSILIDCVHTANYRPQSTKAKLCRSHVQMYYQSTPIHFNPVQTTSGGVHISTLAHSVCIQTGLISSHVYNTVEGVSCYTTQVAKQRRKKKKNISRYSQAYLSTSWCRGLCVLWLRQS